MLAAIYPESHVYTGVIVLMMSELNVVISGLYISKLDIVEGLKGIND